VVKLILRFALNFQDKWGVLTKNKGYNMLRDTLKYFNMSIALLNALFSVNINHFIAWCFIFEIKKANALFFF